MENIPDSRDMHVAFFCKGDSVAYFDIKQMICHMLGVANEMLTTKSDKAVLFLYLLYNPAELPHPPESKQEIMRIYTNTCKAACNYRFEEIFGHIVDFLIREKHISEEPEKVDKIKSSFRFVLCNQNEFIAYIADWLEEKYPPVPEMVPADVFSKLVRLTGGSPPYTKIGGCDII